MQLHNLMVAAGVLIFGACAGSDQNPADTTTVNIDTTSNATASAAPANATSTATPGGTLAPITGTIHEVKMMGDANGYRFDPANITIKAGDGIKFLNVSGGPHNVSFDPATITDPGVKAQLDANMGPNKLGELSSALTSPTPGGDITISFANVKPGTYQIHCMPHLALGMKGTVTVQ